MDNTINGRTPEEIKQGMECCKPVWVDNHWKTCDTKCPYIEDVGGFCRAKLMADSIVLIQRLEHSWDELFETAKQLERERDALKNKPMPWEDVITTDSFLEVKDEYVGAALLQCAFSHYEYYADDDVTFTTHLNDLKIYYRSEYGKSWRCWPRFPTDEERAAAAWEVE